MSTYNTGNTPLNIVVLYSTDITKDITLNRALPTRSTDIQIRSILFTN